MKTLTILFIFLFSFAQAQIPHQKLFVQVDIAAKHIKVVDTLIYKADSSGNFMYRIGHRFQPTLLSSNQKMIYVNSRDSIDIYKILYNDSTGKEVKSIIQYEADILGKLIDNPEYGRSFKETDGIISKNGIYLSGATGWTPWFEDELFTYDLTVKIDTGWMIVSQGKRTEVIKNSIGNLIFYHCPYPMEEVYLIGGRWTEYSQQYGPVLVEAYLQKPDPELAEKYIKATGRYLGLYEKLLGPFPFDRFALVENFWETGYGMPSFTLLGQKVIRFPWILYSSYPHELLHNYWGNSVYVDYSSGNWCEGLTAYLADHLFKEMSNQGADYRRDALQKYLDYTHENNDFPLSEFISRHSAAEEAIGYGKSLMVYHMLRKQLGDSLFLQALRNFYNNYKFHIASWKDIQKTFEEVSGENLSEFFQQWIYRKGAPELKLDRVLLSQEGDKLKLSISLKQVQKEEVYRLHIPIAVMFEGNEEAEIRWFDMDSKYQTFYWLTDPNKRPLEVRVDPLFDVMRKPDRAEVPVTVSTILGKENHLIIYPRQSDLYNEYYEFAMAFQDFLKKQGKKARTMTDGSVTDIPKDRAVWILGQKNTYTVLNKNLDNLTKQLSDEDREKIQQAMKEGTSVWVYGNPDDADQAFGFILTHDMYALPNLLHKLPHYGKYSYLAFKERYLQNTLKGVYPVLNSPMYYRLKYKSGVPEYRFQLPQIPSLVK